MKTRDSALVSTEARGPNAAPNVCDLRPDGKPFRGVESYPLLGVRWWRRWTEADMYFRCLACPVMVRVPCAPVDRTSMIRLMRQYHAAWRAQEDDPFLRARLTELWLSEREHPTGEVAYDRMGLPVARMPHERIQPPAWDMVPAVWGVPMPAPTLKMSMRKLRQLQEERLAAAMLRDSAERWPGQ